jgi:hypothetical protein
VCSPLLWKRGRPDCAAVAPEERVYLIRRVCNFLSYWLCAVRFDSRTNLRGGGGVCNELWLWFITVSPSEEFMSGMYAWGKEKGKRNVHERRGGTISLIALVFVLVSVPPSITSPALSPFDDSFILCCEYNYASRPREVVTVASTAYNKEQRHLTRFASPFVFVDPLTPRFASSFDPFHNSFLRFASSLVSFPNPLPSTLPLSDFSRFASSFVSFSEFLSVRPCNSSPFASVLPLLSNLSPSVFSPSCRLLLIQRCSPIPTMSTRRSVDWIGWNLCYMSFSPDLQ